MADATQHSCRHHPHRHDQSPDHRVRHVVRLLPLSSTLIPHRLLCRNLAGPLNSLPLPADPVLSSASGGSWRDMAKGRGVLPGSWKGPGVSGVPSCPAPAAQMVPPAFGLCSMGLAQGLASAVWAASLAQASALRTAGPAPECQWLPDTNTVPQPPLKQFLRRLPLVRQLPRKSLFWHPGKWIPESSRERTSSEVHRFAH